MATRVPRGTPTNVNRNGPGVSFPLSIPHTVPPSAGATVAATSVTTVPGTALANKRQIGDMITHLITGDNHLWQALTSLQQQANGIVNNVQDWTSWNPKISDDHNVVLKSTELSAYYMTFGTVMFTEVRAETLQITGNANRILIDLPVDVGETIYKTCVAYLIPPALNGNGVIGLEAQKQMATIYINTSLVRGVTCKFLMGGSLGIIQGS